MISTVQISSLSETVYIFVVSTIVFECTYPTIYYMKNNLPIFDVILEYS